MWGREEGEQEEEQKQGRKSAEWYRAHARLIPPSVTARSLRFTRISLLKTEALEAFG